MSYTLHTLFTKVNYTPLTNKKNEWIVIHYTGNKTDKAKANANYFYSVNRNASAHYFVDEHNIYQVVKDSDKAWHVGRNYGKNNLFGKCTNMNSIGIEMCSTNGEIADATFDNTVALTKELMKKYNIPADHVVTHWMTCSKRCPGWNGWIPPNESIWKVFKNDISSITTSPSQPIKSQSTDEVTPNKSFKIRVKVSTLNIRKSPSTSSAVVGKITDNGIYTITEVSGNWGKLKSGAGWISIASAYVTKL